MLKQLLLSLLFVSTLVLAFPVNTFAQDGDDDSAAAAPDEAPGDQASAEEEDVVAAFQAIVEAAKALKGLKGKALAAGIMALLAAIFTFLRIVARKWGGKVFKKEKVLNIITISLSVGAGLVVIIGSAIDGKTDIVSAIMLAMSGPITVVIDLIRGAKEA